MELHTLLHSIRTILYNRNETVSFAELARDSGQLAICSSRNMEELFTGGVLLYQRAGIQAFDKDRLMERVAQFFSTEWVILIVPTENSLEVSFRYHDRVVGMFELGLEDPARKSSRSYMFAIADQYLDLLTS